MSTTYQLWHRRQHQCDRGPGEEAGHPVQRPGHQHAQVVLHLLHPGLRGGREGHHRGPRQQGERSRENEVDQR